ncbi:mycothiol system anti-sigma-R factor [Micromonospora pattaloongensis]|uniref:Mycothiol system anti-sigma-R factor n=1 Tax=Micromonospora pattaloongensis TaxID=405436 RepID=A0A1H3G185_9ACTN|nr:mycothiol system anti-sigma-R factor [Micromonospora pattaloongensis]SDX96900.1 mycothiol system anti-sigma-R factor [Micromonospora pattaloongensis]
MSCGNPHETDCRDVLAEVYLYLDLECAEGRREVIKHHLEECRPCFQEYGIEQEVKALVARCCGGERAPEELRERLRVKIRDLVLETDPREFQTDRTAD